MNACAEVSPAISLLCLPCAGASAATLYLRWRRHMPAWVRVLPVELPGRGERLSEPWVSDFGTLVAQLHREQHGLMRGRYALFGHSMGAVLAWGLAQAQRVQGGEPPMALFASGSPAPSRRDPGRYARTDDAALIGDLRRLGGTPEEVLESPELLRITLDMLRADYQVCASAPASDVSLLSLPLHVFGGRQDDIDGDRLWAWQETSSATCTLDWFDGGHFFLREQERAVLAAIVHLLAVQAARAEAAA